jgi:hypothetical protein
LQASESRGTKGQKPTYGEQFFRKAGFGFKDYFVNEFCELLPYKSVKIARELNSDKAAL